MISPRSLSPLAFVGATFLAACGSSSASPATVPAGSAGAAGAAGSSGGAAGAAGSAGAAQDPTSWTVRTAGPFACGHRELTTTYTPLGGLPARTIPVHVWYPSNTATGDHPKYHAAFADTVAFDDVPPAPPAFASGYPVLVHSHGYKGFAGNSARLMCHLASHGWLAVAPEHVGNLINDTPAKLPLAIYVQRPLDVRASLDLVASLPSGDALAGKADLGHVGMSGHSFGSYTAWVVGGAAIDGGWMSAQCASGEITPCSDALLAVLKGDLSEPRAKVVMPLAGAPNTEIGAGYDGAKVPVLQMDGSLNDVGNDVPWGATNKKVDLTWVTVDGGCHQLFGLGNTIYGDAGCAVLPDEDGFALVHPWVLAYARYHVLGDRSAEVSGLVTGATSLSPLVHVKHEMP